MHSGEHRFNRWIALLVTGCAALSIVRFGTAALPQRAPRMTLFEAVRRGDVATATLLLDRGADPNAREVVLTKPSLVDRTKGGKPTLADTALMIAVHNGHTELVSLLLRKGADVNGKGRVGSTPLIEAVRRRRADLAKLLLEHGARPNQQDDYYGDTAIVFAADEEQAALITLLLDHGAQINGGSGQTPLALAAARGWQDGVELLIARGADANLRRNGFYSPLECALTHVVADLIRKAGGRGRPEETLRKESDRRFKEWAQWTAQQQAKAQRKSRDRRLTAEDRQVIETVLLDLLSYKGADLPVFRDRTSADIILFNKTAPGRGLTLTVDQINSELDDKQANDVSLEIREHLTQRNGGPISLAAFKPRSPHILLESEATAWSKFGRFLDKGPKARAWAEIYLPGYAKSHDRAVLLFSFGPSPHGAVGTYLLMKHRGVWRVRWRDFAY